jgi:hypothetical protein
VLDTAERRTKAGKPLEQDEIDAMTARLVDDTKKLYGEPRTVPPHGSEVWFMRKEGEDWRRWPDNSRPKAPTPEEISRLAPYHDPDKGLHFTVVGGVHFFAIRFGNGASGRVWDARNGWSPSRRQVP